MKNSLWKITDNETGESYITDMQGVLDVINADRSDEWTDYNQSDFREGWDEWVEYADLTKV